MLGRPHPGLAWYEAALACLVLALLAILASAIWPQQTIALMETHKLRIAAKPLGLAKIDASESQINLQFIPNPPRNAGVRNLMKSPNVCSIENCSTTHILYSGSNS